VYVEGESFIETKADGQVILEVPKNLDLQVKEKVWNSFEEFNELKFVSQKNPTQQEIWHSFSTFEQVEDALEEETKEDMASRAPVNNNAMDPTTDNSDRQKVTEREVKQVVDVVSVYKDALKAYLLEHPELGKIISYDFCQF